MLTTCMVWTMLPPRIGEVLHAWTPVMRLSLCEQADASQPGRSRDDVGEHLRHHRLWEELCQPDEVRRVREAELGDVPVEAPLAILLY